MPDAQVIGDLDASVAWAARQGADARRLGITGFCWGGRIVWLYAAHNPAVKAGVAWYGRLVGDVAVRSSPARRRPRRRAAGAGARAVRRPGQRHPAGHGREDEGGAGRRQRAATRRRSSSSTPRRPTPSTPTTGPATARRPPKTAGSAASPGSRPTAWLDRAVSGSTTGPTAPHGAAWLLRVSMTLPTSCWPPLPAACCRCSSPPA